VLELTRITRKHELNIEQHPLFCQHWHLTKRLSPRDQEFAAHRDGFQGAKIGHLSQLADLQIHLLAASVAEAFSWRPSELTNRYVHHKSYSDHCKVPIGRGGPSGKWSTRYACFLRDICESIEGKKTIRHHILSCKKVGRKTCLPEDFNCHLETSWHIESV
jgi:hypothetical protein